MKALKWTTIVYITALAPNARGADDAFWRGQEPSHVERKVNDLLAGIDLEEKFSLLSGDPKTHLDTLPIERLGIPSLSMSDGPHGVRQGEATCFPVGSAMGGSWDVELVRKTGVALARESLDKGRNTLLGPCVNLHRTPYGGRNFESFSEDPILAGRLAAGYVQGVQSQGVLAVVKHFAANDQEEFRRHVDVRIDERALREAHLLPFEMAVKEGGAWALMAAYNKVNGVHACESPFLLQRMAKGEWGFQGIVMSDWLAVHSTIPSANAGLDLEMPCTDFFGDALRSAVAQGDVSQDAIDDKVRRILRVMAVSGILDRGEAKAVQPPKTASFQSSSFSSTSRVDSPEHRALALELARSGMVLLKNEMDILPLDRTKVRSLAVIGPNAAIARIGGSGSSEVSPSYAVSPLEGILKKVGSSVAVEYVRGCGQDSTEDFYIIPAERLTPPGGSGSGLYAEYFPSADMSCQPTVARVEPAIDLVWVYDAPAPELPSDAFSARFTGKLLPEKTGPHRLAVISDDVFRLYVDSILALSNDQGRERQCIRAKTLDLIAGRAYDIRLEYEEKGQFASIKLGWIPPSDDSIERAVKAARNAEVVVVCVGSNAFFEGEGHDRVSLELPGDQAELVKAVCAANPKTIVVLNNGGPFVPTDWLEQSPAVIEAWYPGQEGGHALADVLFGDCDPGGRMPFTWPYAWEDCPAYGNYPGDGREVIYEEGELFGYRWFESRRVTPLFPFGHGLSYTAFDYQNLCVAPADGASPHMFDISFTVENTGKRAGFDVAQLYVALPELGQSKTPKYLKAFQKAYLQPGERQDVRFALSRRELSRYDIETGEWKMPQGEYTFYVGASSTDIRLQSFVETQ